MNSGPLTAVIAMLMLAWVPICWPGEAVIAGFQSQDETLTHGQGVLRHVDFGSQSVIIGGLEYHFAADALVQIDGGPGAWSMLQEDTKVDFLYRADSNVRRTIVELYTLAPGSHIDEH